KLVNDTVLDLGLGKYCMDGCVKSRKIVGTGNENILYTAIFQTIQYGCAELGALIFADPHPQNIFPAVQTYANGNVNGLFHDLAVAADVVVNGVQEHHRIDGLQRPLLPLFGDGKDLVRDPAYGAVRYRNPIDVLDMGLNIAGGHALGVHGQDLFLDRKSTRLNSSHVSISYAVFCLNKN